MKPLEKLLQEVRKGFPKGDYALDLTENPNGSSFLDIRLDGYRLNVEWRKKHGFGLTARTKGGYGEGADEVFPELGPAVRRVLWLLERKAPTSAPLAAQLRELRRKRRLTQEELAHRLGVKQSSVSKLESRGGSIGLRTLQELIAAMGGQLSLRVVFPESDEVDELSLGSVRTGTDG